MFHKCIGLGWIFNSSLYLNNIVAYCSCTPVLLYTDEMIKVSDDIFVSFPGGAGDDGLALITMQ